VLDFGIAKLKEARAGEGLRTVTGVIIGTPQHLSPEQAMGKCSEELDGRSDLYSLSLVIYQMLTRELPFRADSAAGWMLAHLQEPPRPIHTARPHLVIPEAPRVVCIHTRSLATGGEQGKGVAADLHSLVAAFRSPLPRGESPIGLLTSTWQL
jgi:eukaryotic-like serine/threonine-protein kinase